MSFWRRPVVKRIAGGIFLLWLLVVSVYQSISAIHMLVTGQARGGAATLRGIALPKRSSAKCARSPSGASCPRI